MIAILSPIIKGESTSAGNSDSPARAFQFAELSAPDAELKMAGRASLRLEGLRFRLAQFQHKLGEEARANSQLVDKNGKDFPLPYIAQELGYRDEEFESFLADLKELEEWGFLEISGSTAAIVAQKKDTEVRMEEVKAEHPEFVEEFYKVLPDECSHSLAQNHVYRAVAEIPDDEFLVAKDEILRAAKAYAISDELLNALARDPDSPKVLRAHKFIQDRHWEQSFNPAFSENELPELREFYKRFQETKKRLGKEADKSCSPFLLAVKIQRDKQAKQQLGSEKDVLSQILCLETLKRQSTSQGWKSGSPPSIAAYVSKQFWKKISPQAAKAPKHQPSATAPSVVTPEAPNAPIALPDRKPVDQSAPPSNSHPEPAADLPLPPPPTIIPLQTTNALSSPNESGIVAPPSKPLPESPSKALLSEPLAPPPRPSAPKFQPPPETTKSTSPPTQQTLPKAPAPSPTAKPDLPPPPNTSTIAPAGTAKDVSTVQAFIDSFPRQVIQQSHPACTHAAYARFPPRDRPTAAQLQKLSREIQRSWIWTLKRSGNASGYKLPNIENLISSKKWLSEITPAITPEQIEVIEKSTGGQELPQEFHDEIVAEMIKGKSVERIRENGRTEYQKPLDLTIPKTLATLVKKKALDRQEVKSVIEPASHQE